MKILLAFDGSPGSRAAADEVCQRPWPGGSELRVVTVLPSLASYFNQRSAFPTTSACEYLMKEQGDQAASAQSALVADLKRRAAFSAVSQVLLEGRPKEVIVAEAERWGADLVVLGSHGYGVVGRFMLGSVSLAVSSTAPCSVEIVRAR